MVSFFFQISNSCSYLLAIEILVSFTLTHIHTHMFVSPTDSSLNILQFKLNVLIKYSLLKWLLSWFLQNGTLQDLIDHVCRTHVPLEEQQILELFISVCRGLHAMHTCKNGCLAHNDIKVSLARWVKWEMGWKSLKRASVVFHLVSSCLM